MTGRGLAVRRRLDDRRRGRQLSLRQGDIDLLSLPGFDAAPHAARLAADARHQSARRLAGWAAGAWIVAMLVFAVWWKARYG
ncbi:MAG: hypothetical protein Q8L23_15770 [Caulobacter sp.]|nr:hypothetical protein [Caulobacter sp.]